MRVATMKSEAYTTGIEIPSAEDTYIINILAAKMKFESRYLNIHCKGYLE